jgi:hypothetical protein
MIEDTEFAAWLVTTSPISIQRHPLRSDLDFIVHHSTVALSRTSGTSSCVSCQASWPTVRRHSHNFCVGIRSSAIWLFIIDINSGPPIKYPRWCFLLNPTPRWSMQNPPAPQPARRARAIHIHSNPRRRRPQPPTPCLMLYSAIIF